MGARIVPRIVHGEDLEAGGSGRFLEPDARSREPVVEGARGGDHSPTMEIAPSSLAAAVLLGIAATATMDLWNLFLLRAFAIPSLDYCLLGRWLLHMPGGTFTEQVFGSLKEKDILRLEGPLGSFFLREDSTRPIVLLASGTGFAPIKAIIEHMQHQGITRAATLYWGGRRPRDLYMNDWCERMTRELPGLRYVPVVSDALPEDGWSGRTGFVHRAVMQDLPDLSAYQVYACGAPVVVDAAQRDFVASCGLPAEEFYADSFTSEADKHGAM